MSLSWDEPENDGGCPILSYYVWRDDGITGEPSIEVNRYMDPDVRNIPTLRNVDVSLLSTNLGIKYTFKLFAQNREGTTMSPLISYLFATEP
jgi:hypothetical protein